MLLLLLLLLSFSHERAQQVSGRDDKWMMGCF
jgi:hypothetical protein